MRFLSIAILSLAITISSFQIVNAQRPTPSYEDWEGVVKASKLSPEMAQLKKDRLLVTDRTTKQIFTPYLEGNQPIFITSDSLLNGYHVLYEESIFRLEEKRASRLPEILQFILKNMKDVDKDIKGKPELVAAAKKRAMLVAGIAMRLMDDSFKFKDVSLDKIIDQEIKKIVEAQAVEMPTWLGKPDGTFTAIDYSRYKPRGFYTRSEPLQRYFRAVSWLQSIPFRVEKDEELLSILMLGNCVTHQRFRKDPIKHETYRAFFRAYSSFIGSGDDWDLINAAHEAQNTLRMDLAGGGLEKKRSWLKKKANNYDEGPLVNDQLRFLPDDPTKTAEPNFRIISAYRVPSAILFQRTADLRRFNRLFPNGLEIPVALGSEFARKNLSEPEKEKILKTIDASQKYFKGNSLYFEYLDVLKTLLAKPEPDAPDFMKGEAWQRKSCNTVLAGWAQLRHTWALQAKQSVHYLGLTQVPDGFVEPNPEFFSKMADLAAKTREQLDALEALQKDNKELIRQLENMHALLKTSRNMEDFQKKLRMLPQEDLMGCESAFMIMMACPSEAERESEAYYQDCTKWIGTVAADLKKGQIEKYPIVKWILKENNSDLKALWIRLENMSRRLEVIAHKQLRGADLNESEKRFLKSYGQELAGIMLYGGNSYLTPRDDAPRVVDVFTNPQEKKHLHVGIGRPRIIYVLYPWKDKTVLCIGAVMPYYEFVSSSRLTDQDWKAKLDSAKRPPIPKWLAPIVSGGKLSKPKWDKESQ